MPYKAIRFVGLMSVLMGACWIGALVWVTFWAGAGSEPVSFSAVGQGFGFVLAMLGWLASHVSRIVERQADQIAMLERTVAELQTSSGSRRAG